MGEQIYEVVCPEKMNGSVLARVQVPGSKSITNRALLLAAMAEGESTIRGCLTSDDAEYFLKCLGDLGLSVKKTVSAGLGSDVTIKGLGGRIPNGNAEIYVGSAGTAARFLVAMLAFSGGVCTVRSSLQMQKRPMQPLIEVLENAGAKVVCMEEKGHFPMRVTGVADKSRIPDHFTVNIDQSSQFLSALLIAVGTLGKSAAISVTGSHGLRYVDLTAEMIRRFGVPVEKGQTLDGQIEYRFSGEGSYRPLVYEVEPDMSAAAYFYAMAALLGAKVAVRGVNRFTMQGDLAFLRVLVRMGAVAAGLEDDGESTDVCRDIVVTGPAGGKLKGGFSVDMSAFSDQALTLAAIAPFADAPVTITGIGHIRLQECDRIRAIVQNLSALGISVREMPDGVTIYPGTPKGCEIETYEDHRVAMSFALTGLRTPGVRILNPSCCKKTFAQYFDVFEQTLGQLSGKSL